MKGSAHPRSALRGFATAAFVLLCSMFQRKNPPGSNTASGKSQPAIDFDAVSAVSAVRRAVSRTPDSSGTSGRVKPAGIASAIRLGATGLMGLTAGGWVADGLHARFRRGRLLYGALAMLLSAPLLWLGLTRPAGDITGVTLFVGLGWMLYFQYYVSVYASIQDVVRPQLRATAMSVYFFFQYILGAAFGTLITGYFSDQHAASLLAAAGGTEMTDAFRALGLQWALANLVPLMMALTGIALAVAAWRSLRDGERMRAELAAG